MLATAAFRRKPTMCHNLYQLILNKTLLNVPYYPSYTRKYQVSLWEADSISALSDLQSKALSLYLA